MPFQPGNNANPTGRPASAFNMQNFKDRVSKVMEKYEPDQLIAMGNRIASGKKENVSSYDALIIVQLSSALQKDGKERERLLDRLLGKPVQRIGGENEGEPIAIRKSFAFENMDTETLLQIADILQAEKQKTIDAAYTVIEDKTGGDGGD